MKLRVSLLLLSAFMLTAVAATAGISAESAFKSAPRHVFPMLDETTRLDMVDYFHSVNNKGAHNAFGGTSSVTAVTPETMHIAMTEASTYQLSVIPASSDTLIALIITVSTPAPDSKMTVYTSDWKRNVTADVFRKPLFRDWLNDAGRKNNDEVEALVPFLLIGYSYDPATMTLTLTNNTRQFLAREIYEMVEPYLLSELTYRFDGKKFSRTER